MLLVVLLPSCPFLSVACCTELLHFFYFFHQLSSQFKWICCCCQQLHKSGLCWNITSTSNYEEDVSRGFFITFYIGFVPLRLRFPPSMHSVLLDQSSVRDICLKSHHIIKFRSWNQPYKLPFPQKKKNKKLPKPSALSHPCQISYNGKQKPDLIFARYLSEICSFSSALACKLTLLPSFLSLEESCGQYIHASR